MTRLEKVHIVTGHFKDIDPQKIKDALQAAHASIKKHLNLPDNIKLTGLKFDAIGPNEALEDCNPCSSMDAQGNTVLGCC